MRGAIALVLQPPPIRGLSQTGGFEFMIEDRDGRGVEALAQVTDRFLEDRETSDPSSAGSSPRSRRSVPQLRFELDRVKAQRLDVAVSDVFTVLQTNLGGLLRQRLQPLRQGLEGDGPGRGRHRRRPAGRHRHTVRPQPGRGRRVPLDALGDAVYDAGADRCSALQHVQCGQDHRPAGAGVQLGPGDRRDGAGGRRGLAGGVFV